MISSINTTNKFLVVCSGHMPGEFDDWDVVIVPPGEEIPEVAANCPRPEELIWGGIFEKDSIESAENFRRYRLGF